MYRRLGVGEHLLWLYDQAVPCHFTLTAQVVGEFSTDQLQQALAQVQQRHPLLRVRIVLDIYRQPWFIEDVASIPLRVLQRQSEKHWEQIVEQEFSHPFDWSQAPLVRVVVLHSSNVSELVVTCHHSIADGLSTAYLLRDILQVLGTPNCEQQLLPKRPPFEALIPEIALASKDNISHQDLENSTQTAFAPKAVSQLFMADDEPKSNIQTLESTINNSTNAEAILSQSSRPRLLSWSLSKEETSTLINRCRQEQTSVHAAICAAFLLAIDSESDTKAQQNHFQEPSTLRCLSPVNIRRLLSPPIEEDFGYYFCLTLTSVTVTPNLTLWNLARSLKSQLNQQTLPNAIFAHIPETQAFLSTNPSPNIVRDMLQDSKGYDVLVSNLGQLNIQKQFGHLHIAAIYAPATITPIYKQFVGVATLEDKMFFTLVYSDISPAKVELLQKAAMQQLVL
ncbi:condensation domain-containing protein [Brasilonema sp. UFV-L1]|uniref:condensation domain-containing protein n=1 Tax=Brasilonema sp. UFV-L1 TaxID=2234130 RepID=UPI00145C97F8|nr:condensation domain-containing protein [Brasilonema sp. UFV-L1]NMG10037.1 hypothetical protein [Brasilonema sp. UFV-L1]